MPRNKSEKQIQAELEALEFAQRVALEHEKKVEAFAREALEFLTNAPQIQFETFPRWSGNDPNYRRKCVAS